LTHYVYDSLTGRLATMIADVDAGDGYSLPTFDLSGWPSLPVADQGVSAQGDYQRDALGRATQWLGPQRYAVLPDGTSALVRSAAWTVYGDAVQTTWTAEGYVLAASPSVGYLVGPVSMTITDHVGRVTDQIQAVYHGTIADLRNDLGDFLSGGTDPLPISSYVSWTASNYSHTHLVATAVYHAIDPAWTTSRQNGAMAWLANRDNPAALFMGSAANYTATVYGYEANYAGGGSPSDVPSYMNRLNRVVAPDGTITRYVLDARGNVVETWIGTNDDNANDRYPQGVGPSGELKRDRSNIDKRGGRGRIQACHVQRDARRAGWRFTS
jgi:hypothetical protein